MAKTTIDLSGIGGLAPRWQGDRFSSVANWQDRILGNSNMYADGVVNPLSKYGYVTGAVNTFATITGALTQVASATIVDTFNTDTNADAYIFDRGSSVWRLSTLSDTSLEDIIVTFGAEGTDLEIYTINGVKKLFFSYKLAGGGDIGISPLPYVDTSDDDWLSTAASGAFHTGATNNTRMIVADNGFMYVLDGSAVHKIDGTTDGGANGTATANVLLFPATFSLIDAIDLRGQMWIALMRTSRDIFAGTLNVAKYSEFTGVYIWDRQSTKVDMTDFITIEGVKEVRTIIGFRGIPWVFTVSADGHTQLRKYTGTEFSIVCELGLTDYPRYHDSVSVTDDFIIWTANNGNVFMYGKIDYSAQDALYKIGDLTSATPDGETFQFAGAMLPMGTQYSGTTGFENEGISYYMSFETDTSPYFYTRRWVPYMAYYEGNGQFPHAGNFKSMVKLLPKLSHVKSVTLFYPKTNTGSGSTEVLDVDLYFNQSRTSWGTKTLTRDDGVRGYKFISIGEPNVNSIQLGLTWKTNNGLTATITPSYCEVEYEETKKIK